MNKIYKADVMIIITIVIVKSCNTVKLSKKVNLDLARVHSRPNLQYPMNEAHVQSPRRLFLNEYLDARPLSLVYL